MTIIVCLLFRVQKVLFLAVNHSSTLTKKKLSCKYNFFVAALLFLVVLFRCLQVKLQNNSLSTRAALDEFHSFPFFHHLLLLFNGISGQ